MSVLKLLKLLDEKNIADSLDDEDLKQIGDLCIQDYKNDEHSRREWVDKTKEALKLAMQMVDPKDTPWEKCANVTYPLITVSAITGASRIYPEVIKEDGVVGFKINGMDPDGTKSAIARRLADFQSYQLTCQNKNWMDETDKLLHMLFVVGTVFRKVYFDPICGYPKAELCNPQDIIVNNRLTGLDGAERITHRFSVPRNYIVERQRAGYFREIPLETLEKVRAKPKDGQLVLIDETNSPINELNNAKNKFADNGQYELIEMHRYLDLDDDGYLEPYIVVVHTGNNSVLAIYPRFGMDSIKLNDDEEIQKIDADLFFSDYHLIPALDGSYYSIGLGSLLLPINNSINSVMNNLIDSGTLMTTKTFFYNRMFKIRGNKLKMGEGHPVDTPPGTRIADMISELPFSEPSQVLFQLLGLLIQSGNQIASINEVLLGQALPQNAPAGSTQELANQGLKMFSSIYKRFCQNLSNEYKLLYQLNKRHIEEMQTFNYNNSLNYVTPEDFRYDDIDLIPVADPSLASESQRTSQIMTLVNLFNTPIASVLNPYSTAIRIMDQMRMPNPQELMAQPQETPPDPDMVKAEIAQQKNQMEAQLKEKELMLKAQEVLTKAKQVQIKQQESAAKIIKMKADAMKDHAAAIATDRKYDIDEDRVRIMEKKINVDARGT